MSQTARMIIVGERINGTLIFPVSAEPEAGMLALAVMDRLKAAFPGVHAI